MNNINSKHLTKFSSAQGLACKVPAGSKQEAWGHVEELVVQRLKRV